MLVDSHADVDSAHFKLSHGQTRCTLMTLTPSNTPVHGNGVDRDTSDCCEKNLTVFQTRTSSLNTNTEKHTKLLYSTNTTSAPLWRVFFNGLRERKAKAAKPGNLDSAL